jgi:molecular chaperone HtpG
MLSDEKFFDKAKKFALLKNIDSQYFSLEEYKEKIKENQTDKENKLVFLYTTDKDAQYSYISEAKDRGYDVLELDGPLVSHVVNKYEQFFENSTFARVDADVIDKLIKKNDIAEVALTDDEKKQIETLIEKNLSKDKFMVSFENLGESGQPMVITRPEFIRRMVEMQQSSGGGMFGGSFPESFNLIVNGNHPLVSKVLKEVDDNKKEKLTKQMTDLALLSQNMLKGQALADFVKRSVELI